MIPLPLYKDFFCLFSQQTLKFSDTGWKTAIIIIQHLALTNPLGLNDLSVRPGLGYMQHSTEFHLIQTPCILYSIPL